MKCVLTINAGSSSLKVAAFRDDSVERLSTVTISSIGQVATMTSVAGGIQRHASLAGVHNHDTALGVAVETIADQLGTIDWIAVGHRVTHGRDYLGPRIVDAATRRALEALVPLAPLHQPHNLAGIAAAERLAPRALQVACFDTSFHRTIPDLAKRYALPTMPSTDGIEGYGFHGLSYEYIASILPEYLGTRARGRVIVAHLGSGASMCAMRELTSIATTMGLTPLDGLPMATRVGAIDPGAVLYLLQQPGMTATSLRDMLYQQSGLLGVSGLSGSMKDLVDSSDPRAAEAVELFIYRAAGTIGSLAAALEGLDAVVFTGGIGENSATIRGRLARRIAWLGAQLDDAAHAKGRAVFSSAASQVSLCVVATDEELMIARHVLELTGRM